MNYRKFRKNMKAISPIISVLLMIAIAVVASLVVYAWVMGYIGYQTGKTGDSVVIQSVSWSSDTTNTLATPVTGAYPTAIYLQNIGSTTVTVLYGQSLYINNALETGATFNVVTTASPTANYVLTPGSTVEIIPAALAPANAANIQQGSTVTIKVTTLGGTYSQVTQQVP